MQQRRDARFRPLAGLVSILLVSVPTACAETPAGPFLLDVPAASVAGAGADPAGVCSPLALIPLVADNGAALAGQVTAANDETTLFITLETSGGWTLVRSQVFVGGSAADIPVSGGNNPTPGRFPYKNVHGAGSTSFTYGIPLSALDPDAPIVIAVHAEAALGSRNEGAWADGTPIRPGGNWGTYFVYSAVGCTSEPVTSSSGGLLTFENLSFSVPPNAVLSDVIITAVPVDVGLLQPPTGPTPTANTAITSSLDWNSVLRIPGTGWDMGPDGLTFDVPASITIAYDEADLPPGVSEDQLTIFAINGVFFALPSTVDAVNNTVTAQVAHFTTFFVGANPVNVDLSVSRFAEIADPVKLGDQAEYSTDIMNLGPDDASGAIVTYTAFGDVSITQLVPGCTEITNPIFGDVAVSCPVNRAIPAGGTEGAPSFLVEANSTGDITVWASVSPVAGETDPDFANNRLENTTTIEPAVVVDLTVSRFAELADPVKLGDQAEYSTDIMNLGPDDASGATVTYTAFGDVSITQLVPGCTEITNPIFGDVAVSCPVNRAIPSGGTEGAPSFLVEANSTGDITVWASVSPVAGETDPDFANNRLENTTTIEPAVLADLTVSRFAEIDDPVMLGDQAEYSTDIMNLGPDHASGAVVTYTAFGDVTISQLVPGCTEIVNPIFGDAAVTCPVNRAIPAGGTEGAPSFLVEATSTGDITVWASVSTINGEVDSNSANNRLENTTTIVPASAFSGLVAFVSDRDGTRDLYVKNLATGVVTQLTDDAATEASPEWSPDGSRIAYDKTTNALGTGSDIFVINANGANETRLTFNLDSFHPTWSPDGAELAYQDRNDGDWEIMVLNVADPSIKRKLTDNTVQDLEPDWSGGSILFRRTNLVGGSTLNTMDAADGGNLVEVVSLGALFAPAFSPDGGRIVYERRAGTAWSIEMLTLGGGTTVIVNDGVRNTGPAFSPDGANVIFAKNIDLATQVFHLWVTKADGTAAAQSVETSLGNDLHPNWR